MERAGRILQLLGDPVLREGAAAGAVLVFSTAAVVVGLCLFGDWNVLCRIMKLYKLDEKQAADKIRKTDRDRKNYYEARTKREWGGIDSNSMMFNASLLGIDGVVDALEAIYRKWESRK